MSSSVPVYFVDAFTSRSFAGNNAAIVILSNHEWNQASQQWMQKVAAELNQPTTAFISHSKQSVQHTMTPHPTGLSHLASSSTNIDVRDIHTNYTIRWFTPVTEFEPCGHATLAASYVLYTTSKVPINHSIKFHCTSGIILNARVAHHSPLAEIELLQLMAQPGTPTVPMIELEFPADPPTRLSATDKTLPMIQRMVTQCIGEEHVIRSLRTSSKDLIVVLESVADVIALKLRFDVISQLVSNALIVTARNDKAMNFEGVEPHFVSRVFLPSIGLNEDAVTGSAHRALACIWSDEIGVDELIAYQASSRGGIVRMQRQGDRIHLKGEARIVLNGQLSVGVE